MHTPGSNIHYTNIIKCLPIINALSAQKCRLFLMVLHVRCERSGRTVATIANGTLEWLLIVVRFHMYFQMITGNCAENKKNSIESIKFDMN